MTISLVFLLFACAPSTGTTDTFTDTETDSATDTADLTGGMSWKEAIKALGYTPWEYTGPDEQIEFISVDIDDETMVRPWIFVQWEDSNSPTGFEVSGSDYNSAVVLPEQDNYLVCSFQSGLDPMSDPDCAKGLLDTASQHGVDYVDDEGDGLFVKEE